MISLEGVTVEYPGSVPIRNLSTKLGPEPVAVTGPSGCGKSTLLRLISGLQAPTAGRILINEREVSRPSWKSGADPRVVVVYQDYRLVEFLSLVENLLLGAEMRRQTSSRAEAVAALEKVGLGDLDPDRLPGNLSGGEQQRVAIARALVCRAEVLVADEPTGALDSVNTQRIADLLLRIGTDHGVQVLVATHDPVVASRIPGLLDLGHQPVGTSA